MKSKNILIFLLLTLTILPLFFAAQSNSTNYQTEVAISSGGDKTISTNYKTNVVTGLISGDTGSSSFKTLLGLIYVLFNQEDEETPPDDIPPDDIPPEVPGGGGEIILSDFIVDKDLIKVAIKQGDTTREFLEIRNTGSTGLDITIESTLSRFMAISEENFYLEVGETKNIFIDIFAKEDEIPESYIGKIIITGGETIKIINMIIEVRERKPLFDIRLEVISKKVSPGKNVKANIEILNFGDLKNIDILFRYSIQDFDGNILTFKEESIKINDKLNLTRKIKSPDDIPLGDYVFHVKINYENISASSADTFRVVEKVPISFGTIIFYLIISILIIGILILVLLIYRKYKKKNKQKEMLINATKG